MLFQENKKQETCNNCHDYYYEQYIQASTVVVCQNYTEINRFMLWLMEPCDFHYCWSALGARTPGRKCPSCGVEEVVLFRFNKMLNWQKQMFFSLGGGGGGAAERNSCVGEKYIS